MSFVERHVMLSATSVAVMFWLLASSVATKPATAGVAIEVPEKTAYASSLWVIAE